MRGFWRWFDQQPLFPTPLFLVVGLCSWIVMGTLAEAVDAPWWLALPSILGVTFALTYALDREDEDG